MSDWYHGIEEFVLNRKKATGGFGATPKLPATIQDTYHALRILTVLGGYGLVPSPALGNDGPLLEYLARTSAAERHNAQVTFQRLAGILLAGGELSSGPVLDFVRRRLMETQALEERYYCGRLMREVARIDDGEFDFLAKRPAPWSFRTASELWMLLDLAHEQAENPSALAAWLQACQTGDGGFGFLPGTTSFIENCYDCLRALRLLGAAPKDQEGCRAFALACRTSRHGFARRNGGTAFLYSTWQAVAVLDLLRGRSEITSTS